MLADSTRSWPRLCLFVLLVASVVALPRDNAWSQPPTGGSMEVSPVDPLPPTDPPSELPSDKPSPSTGRLNVLDLLLKGGWLMVPIGIMSVAVVMIVVERLIALRRRRVMPVGLIENLAELGAVPGMMDPRAAYRLCQQYPSSAAVVIRSMLLKIGRPQSEVEHAVTEAGQREATRLFANVRWLTLIAAIAPLMGLFGTVWGMIRAFFDTTQLVAGQNKADFLAEGIYVALVTTLGGLAVAIPAAIFAHYFEGRIERLFHEIDELLFNLLPQIERFEGRMRVTPHTLGGADEDPTQPRKTSESTSVDSAKAG